MQVINQNEKLNRVDDNIIKISEVKMKFGGDNPTYTEEMQLRKAMAEHIAILQDELSSANTDNEIDIASFQLKHFRLMLNGEHHDL